MIEKWLLVFLIVGGTSLVFLICFPIDFYLYRRRKRLARENKFPNFEPKPIARAGQCHAKVDVKNSISTVWADDIRRKHVQRPGGFARVVGMIRKKQQDEKTVTKQPKTRNKSENSSDIHVVSETPDTLDTVAFSSDERSHASTAPQAALGGERSTDVSNDDIEPDEFPVIPARKYSNVSAAWSENEELVDRESRYLNYGALQPLDNTGYSQATDRQQKCYSIPIGQRVSMTFVRSVDTTESNTDTDDMQLSSNSEHTRYSPTDSRQDFRHGCKDYEHVKYTKMFANFTSDSNVTRPTDTRRQRSVARDRSLENTYTDETMPNGSSNLGTLSALERSVSDQSFLVSCDTDLDKISPKKNAKNCHVTPSGGSNGMNLGRGCEQFTVCEVDVESAGRKQRGDNALPNGDGNVPPVTSTRTKKKRKKVPLLIKHSSDSLPNLASNQRKY